MYLDGTMAATRKVQFDTFILETVFCEYLLHNPNKVNFISKLSHYNVEKFQGGEYLGKEGYVCMHVCMNIWTIIIIISGHHVCLTPLWLGV